MIEQFSDKKFFLNCSFKAFERRVKVISWMVVLAVSIVLTLNPSEAWSAGRESRDSASSVWQDQGGGYVIAGTSWRLEGMFSRIYAVKLDNKGEISWHRTFGGGDVNRGFSVRGTSEGGYILAGSSWPSGSLQSDLYLVKIDQAGREIWSNSFGGDRQDAGHDVLETGDGGYLAVGGTSSFAEDQWDVYAVKTDSAGNRVWQKTFGGEGRDLGYSVQQADDGGYILAGKTDSFGSGKSDIYLLRLNNSGKELWHKTFGGKGREEGHCVRQTDEGGYVIAAQTDSFGSGDTDVYVIKTDSRGKRLWAKTYGGQYADHGHWVEQTGDGGFVVAGNTWPMGRWGSSDLYLLKLNRDGSREWERTFGGRDFDAGYSVQQTADGGYIVVGRTASPGQRDSGTYIVKTDAAGHAVWIRRGLQGNTLR